MSENAAHVVAVATLLVALGFAISTVTHLASGETQIGMLAAIVTGVFVLCAIVAKATVRR